MGLDQEWQIEAGNGRRPGRRIVIDANEGRQYRRDGGGRISRDEIESQRGVTRRLRLQKLLAPGKGAFAAIVRTRRRNTFTFFAAVRGFLGELSGAEAVERLQEQEDCHQADRNVNAAMHSFTGYQNRGYSA